ncbi:MAG: TetR/AcrR family transcriptional regulator [Bacteroidota bacterium]
MEKDKRTEDRIFEVATEVFLEKGMDGTTMQDIADRAGINKSLLNYYFRSKERLFNAVFELLAGKMMEKLAPVLDESLSLEDKLQFFFNEHISFLQKNPRLPFFLLNEINRNPERLRVFLRGLDVEKLFKVLYSRGYPGAKMKNLTRETTIQLITTIISMSIFPFVSKGVFDVLFEKFGMSFTEYIEVRKQFAANFVITSLDNMKLK